MCVCVALLSFACGDVPEEPVTPGGEEEQPSTPAEGQDAGEATDAGEPDAGATPGPVIDTVDARGTFLPSPTRAILAGTNVTFFGTQGMAFDPQWFGRSASAGREGWVRSGLIALDPQTGAARVYTAADGLPTIAYATPVEDYGVNTAPIFDLVWLTKDQSFAAAAWEHVVRGSVDAQGKWTFSSVQLKAAGQTTFAHVAHLAVAGGELFAGTDQGVAVLEPSTLAVKHWLSFGASMTGPWVASLSSGVVGTEPAVGVVFGPANAAPSHLAMARPGNATATLFSFTDGSKPISTYGMNGSLLVGAAGTDGRGSLFALRAGASSVTLSQQIDADGLTAPMFGNIRPGKMVWDASRERLIIGGAMVSASAGGGVVEVSGAVDGTVYGPAEPLIPSNDPFFDVLPLNVDDLELDATGRLYVVGSRLCSDHKLQQLPVYRVERDESGAVRLVQPYLSGVRDLELDPVNGDTWVAMREELPGLRCDGAPISMGICRVRKDGACEISPTFTNGGSATLSATPTAVDLAFGAPSRKELALATRGDATFVRVNDWTRSLQTQFDPRLSLKMTSMAFSADGGFWAGSQMEWQAQPGLDEVAVNNRGPHGLGYVELDGNGFTTLTRRYVRTASDLTGVEEIAGLSSNTIWAVMPLSGARRALVATGIERTASTYDHQLGTPAPTNAKGGVALIEDTSVSMLSPPAGRTFSDVVALATSSAGTFAVDSVLGVVSVDVTARTTAVWAEPAWAAPERPLSLAVDGNGLVAVGTTSGLYVFGTDKGVTKVIADGARGYVWKLRFMANGALYAGADEGLVRVAIAGGTLPASLGPVSFSGRELWPLPSACGGIDGCVCAGAVDCTTGYACGCAIGGACTCELEDPCTNDPGGLSCACTAGTSTCNSGLMCECSGIGCSCQRDPAACTAPNSCTCADHYECPTDWYCNSGPGTCAPRQACDDDCTCSTASTCSPGLVCQSGIGGSSCI